MLRREENMRIYSWYSLPDLKHDQKVDPSQIKNARYFNWAALDKDSASQ